MPWPYSPETPTLGPRGDIQGPQIHAPRPGFGFVVGELVPSPAEWIKIFLSWLVFVCVSIRVWIAKQEAKTVSFHQRLLYAVCFSFKRLPFLTQNSPAMTKCMQMLTPVFFKLVLVNFICIKMVLLYCKFNSSSNK